MANQPEDSNQADEGKKVRTNLTLSKKTLKQLEVIRSEEHRPSDSNVVEWLVLKASQTKKPAKAAATEKQAA